MRWVKLEMAEGCDGEPGRDQVKWRKDVKKSQLHLKLGVDFEILLLVENVPYCESFRKYNFSSVSAPAFPRSGFLLLPAFVRYQKLRSDCDSAVLNRVLA